VLAAQRHVVPLCEHVERVSGPSSPHTPFHRVLSQSSATTLNGSRRALITSRYTAVAMAA
jgi:hypothetical protein